MTTPDSEIALRRRFPWRLLIGLMLTAGFLGLVFLKVDFRKFARAFAAIHPGYIVGAYLLHVASLIFKAVRWQRLGLAYRHVTVLDCFSAIANGFIVGLLAPGLFEFTRAYVLKRRAQVPFGSVLGVVVAERALDTVLLLALVFVVLTLVPGAQWLTLVAAVLAAAAMIGLALLVLLVVTRRRSVPRIERALSRLSPRFARRVAGFLQSFADGLHRLGELRLQGVLAIGGLSVLLWGCRGLYIFLVLRCLGIQVGFGIALFIVAIEYFGMLIRLTPAALGQYQIVVVAVLMAFSIDKTLAASASIVLHGVRFLVILSLGLPFLYREHLDLSRLAREKAAAKKRGNSLGTGAAE